MAHNDTVFAQVLKLVPRHEFESLARKHKSGRMSRSMTRWGQFVAMGMAQLTGRCSLRDIVSNLAAQSCKLYHLGVGVVTRSSLARVNAEKPWEMYEELHGRLLGRCQAKAPGHGYRFKAKLFSVDSTTIDLCLWRSPFLVGLPTGCRSGGRVADRASGGDAGESARVTGLDHEGYLSPTVATTELVLETAINALTRTLVANLLGKLEDECFRRRASVRRSHLSRRGLVSINGT